jgi:hypothetical protein
VYALQYWATWSADKPTVDAEPPDEPEPKPPKPPPELLEAGDESLALEPAMHGIPQAESVNTAIAAGTMTRIRFLVVVLMVFPLWDFLPHAGSVGPTTTTVAADQATIHWDDPRPARRLPRPVR